MNDLIFNLNRDQLKEIIKTSVREEVTELMNKPEPKEKLLTADQAADFSSYPLGLDKKEVHKMLPHIRQNIL